MCSSQSNSSSLRCCVAPSSGGDRYITWFVILISCTIVYERGHILQINYLQLYEIYVNLTLIPMEDSIRYYILIKGKGCHLIPLFDNCYPIKSIKSDNKKAYSYVWISTSFVCYLHWSISVHAKIQLIILLLQKYLRPGLQGTHQTVT